MLTDELDAVDRVIVHPNRDFGETQRFIFFEAFDLAIDRIEITRGTEAIDQGINNVLRHTLDFGRGGFKRASSSSTIRSMFEARRSLAWRTQIVPPFHGLDQIVDEDDAQFVKDHFEDFAKAYYTRSGQIDNVPPDMVEYL